MTDFDSMVKAIEIFKKHGVNESLAAEHDVIYSYCSSFDIPVDSTDAKELEELGWFFTREFDCWAMFV